MLLDYIHKIKEVSTALISIMTVQLEFIGEKLGSEGLVLISVLKMGS
jgi:hypothetical protein